MMDGFFKRRRVGFVGRVFSSFFFSFLLIFFFNVGRCGNGYEELWFLALLAFE